MGKYKHHSGAIGGGVNLSKGKTPHDSLMKYMPIDDKASGLFKMAKPFEMGVSMRGPLDKKGKHSDSGIYKMDPMHNGKPGVQQDDFEQFESPNEMRGPLNQEDPGQPNRENNITCKPGFVMHRGKCIKKGSKVAVLGKKPKQ
jgi:hypothetical protein